MATSIIANAARFKVVTNAELNVFKKDFNASDIDKDGFLSGDEINKMLEKQLGTMPTAEQVHIHEKLEDVKKTFL